MMNIVWTDLHDVDDVTIVAHMDNVSVSVEPPTCRYMFDSYTDYMNDYIKIVEEELISCSAISRRMHLQLKV